MEERTNDRNSKGKLKKKRFLTLGSRETEQMARQLVLDGQGRREENQNIINWDLNGASKETL